ncbi:SPFH domain-containing protein [Streptomyces sp. NPDC051569]|uniref:SPFH domain-containing protein n=1 Tax=Streptomyces sp. NPDC051569 TaxID=3365661 RepID=UPI0037AEC487
MTTTVQPSDDGPPSWGASRGEPTRRPRPEPGCHVYVPLADALVSPGEAEDRGVAGSRETAGDNDAAAVHRGSAHDGGYDGDGGYHGDQELSGPKTELLDPLPLDALPPGPLPLEPLPPGLLPLEPLMGTAPGPAPAGPWPRQPEFRGTAGGAETARWTPLIVGESTQEIPVHLLFREEAGAREGAGDPLPVRPTVIGRRRGTGEQPRVRRVSAPEPGPAGPSRSVPPVDPKLGERPGPVLPGWSAALVGLGALLGCGAVMWWAGAVPDALTRSFGMVPAPYRGIGLGQRALLVLGVLVMVLAFGGLGRGQVGRAWVLTLFGEYRGSVRRTGLLWVSPLLLRRRVDVRLRHWRGEPMPAVDANGTALRVVVLVVWRVRDTVRAVLGVKDHEEYLREQVEAATARVLSQLPADAFHDEGPTLRDAEAVGDALTRMLAAECRPVGVEIFSAQPTRIEYAPEIAAAMRRSRIAVIDARHRDGVLTAVVDSVEDTVHRLTSRGLVELDDYERKALVKDLTVAFYTGRQGAGERA